MRLHSGKILLLACLLVSTAVNAQIMQLEVIPLNHRMVDEVIPILRPLVSEGGSITGMNNQLIIKTTPDNLAELKQVLASLDRAPRRLMITVKQDVSGNSRSGEQGLSGSYSSGDVTISSRDRPSRDGITITGKDEEGNPLRYRGINSSSSHTDSNTFSVQTLEGRAAFIQTGQSVPLPSRNTYVTPGGVVTQNSLEYRDATSGFYVLPRLNGDRVTLQVSPQLSRVDARGPVFEIQNVETTVTGRLGEWLRVGSLDRTFRDSSGRILDSGSRQGMEKRAILLKVEEIP